MLKPVIRTPALAMVWLSLMTLTIATYGVSRLSLGAASEAVSLTIAVVKTALVAAVFMELRTSDYRVRLLALAGFAWLALLLGLTMTDFFTRHP